MELREHANQLLASAAEVLKLENLELDQRDECIVTFDDRIVVIFSLDTDSLNGLVINVVLGSLPEGPGKAELMYELLAGNYCWSLTEGGVLGIDKSTGVIALSYLVELPMETPGQFPDVCAKLLNVGDYWIRKIGEMDGIVPGAAGIAPYLGNPMDTAIRV
jgi:hypothetical protein